MTWCQLGKPTNSGAKRPHTSHPVFLTISVMKPSPLAGMFKCSAVQMRSVMVARQLDRMLQVPRVSGSGCQPEVLVAFALLSPPMRVHVMVAECIQKGAEDDSAHDQVSTIRNERLVLLIRKLSSIGQERGPAYI